MRIEVHFTHSEFSVAGAAQRVVVVDVLRATSTMVEALANGAKALFPVQSADDAARLAQNIGREQVILCGERKGLRIDGFDLGNAPPEFTPERVRGKTLIMTTTNGTAAFLAVAERTAAGRAGGQNPREAGEPPEILAASFLNLGAAARRLAAADGVAAIVCAGREGRFALEDAICAGALLRRVAETAGSAPELNDAGVASQALAKRYMRSLRGALESTAAARQLESIGRGEDVGFCSELDRHDVVPHYHDRKITLS